MASLTMTQSTIEGRPRGDRLNVTIEPSKHVGDGIRGVFVHVNDHYSADDTGRSVVSERLMSTLAMRFDKSLERADGVMDHIMSLAMPRDSDGT